MRNRDDSRPLYRRVADDITSKIEEGVFAPGDKLPSERALCDQYAVSQITVRRALRELSHSDRVYSHHGLGWFVSEIMENPRARVALVLPEIDALSAKLIQELGKQLAPSNLALYPAFANCDEAEGARMIRSAVDEDTAAALLVVCGKGQSARERYRRLLNDLNCPAILLLRTIDDLDTPTIAMDEPVAMGALTEHLIQQGHRRIAYAGSDPSRIAGQRCYDGFASMLWEHGLELPLDWAFSGSLTQGADGERFRRVIQAPYAPSALVCASNLRAAEALHAMREAGVTCPDGVAVVAMGEQDYAPFLAPALTTYRFDRNAFVETVAKATLAVVRGDRPAGAVIGGELVVRKSCGGPVGLFE